MFVHRAALVYSRSVEYREFSLDPLDDPLVLLVAEVPNRRHRVTASRWSGWLGSMRTSTSPALSESLSGVSQRLLENDRLPKSSQLDGPCAQHA